MWCAKASGVEDCRDIGRLLGENWWFRLREPLLRVVLPDEYYQVRDRNSQSYQWDDLGIRAYCEDLRGYPHIRTIERRQRYGKELGDMRNGSSSDLEWDTSAFYRW